MLGIEMLFPCTFSAFQDTTPALSPPLSGKPRVGRGSRDVWGQMFTSKHLTLRLSLSSCGTSDSIFEEMTTPTVGE